MKKALSALPYTSFFITGNDAISFLQGQLTQDLKKISENHCHFGAFCSAKGSMLANFLIHKQSDAFILRIHNEQASSVMNRLKLFVLRSKVDISPTNYQHLGLNKEAADEFCKQYKVDLPQAFEAITVNQLTLLSLPNNYFELYGSDKIISNHYQAATQSQFNNDKAYINALRLTAGIIDITPNNNEAIMPQQTPLEDWGGISYTKGCYVGQEIIARSKYKGQVRKKLAITRLDGDDHSIEQLSSIKDSQGKPIAKIFDLQPYNSETIIQIISDKTLIGTTLNSEYGSLTISPINSTATN